MSLYAVELIFPFTGTKEPKPNNEKQNQTAISPPPNSKVGLCIRRPDGEGGFISLENAFPLLQSPMVGSFTPLQPTLGITHGDLRLGNWPWKPVS